MLSLRDPARLRYISRIDVAAGSRRGGFVACKMLDRAMMTTVVGLFYTTLRLRGD